MSSPVCGAPVPEAFLPLEIESSDERKVVVGDLWLERPCLFLFLRHFGCIGCAENVRQVAPRLPELQRMQTRTVFIGCGAPFFIEPFRERHNLLHAPVELYSDLSLETYRAVGLAYGLWGGFRPRSLLEMGKAFVAGNQQGEVQGDLRQHAGAMLVDTDGVVRFYHRNESVGDHVSVPAMVRAVTALWLGRKAQGVSS